MKTKILTAACVLAIFSTSVTPCRADSNKPAKIIADVAVLRPAGVVATAVGSVFFVLSLPFSAATHSIKETANTLVLNPARATFQRPLGNMDVVEDFMTD